MAFLKFLKLKFEVRPSDQLMLPIYVILFVVGGLLVEPLVIIVIIRFSIVIVVGHDRLASLPNADYQISSLYFPDGSQGQSFATASGGMRRRAHTTDGALPHNCFRRRIWEARHQHISSQA